MATPLAVHRRVAFPPEWRAEVSRWLRRPNPADVGPGGWLIALMPEHVDAQLRFDRPALQVYQRVTWQAPLPEAADLSVRTAWCSPAGERSEIALASRATTTGGAAAEALLVARLDGTCEPVGERRLPARPDLDGTDDRGLSLVLDREQVQTFARLAGTRHAIHDDPVAARGLGYPDVLVQGAVLLLTVMHFGGSGTKGMAEMWFRQAVPAGTALNLSQTRRPQDQLWTVRASGGAVAAVARLSEIPTCTGEHEHL